MRKLLKNILIGINIIAVISLILSYLSVYIPPDRWWVPAFFGLAYPFILLLNLVFIVLWGLKKSKIAYISAISVLIGLGFISSYYQLLGNKTEKKGMRIISYNVQHFSGKTSTEAKSNATKIVNFLNDQNADIICLQEVRLRTNTIFNIEEAVRKLKSINHYQYARSSTTFGSVTLTRYPIIKMGEVRFKQSRNITIYTDVVIKKDTVRIFNVHLQSYHIDPRHYSIIESPGFDEEEDIKEAHEVGKKMITAFQQRAEQARVIKRYIKESPHPVIVCGDFNDTPSSFSYQQVKGKLRDAFIESGKGLGRTYIGKLPSFRIDFILHNKEYRAYNFQNLNFRLSDHLPVSCELIKK